MDYSKKTVRSRPGLTQTEALLSLQSAFPVGTRIASISLSAADRWVADIQIPKKHSGPFPPPEGGESGPLKEEGSDSEDSGGPDESESPDSDGPSDSPDGGGDSDKKPPSKGDKPGSDAQVVDLLTQILHALGGGDPMGGMGGPDDLGPGMGGPPAPPPHGGPAGGPGAPAGPKGMGAGRPMKPGEVPQKPGMVPVGAPAFSSVRTANPLDPAMMGAPPAPAGGPMAPGPNPLDPGMAGPPVPGPTSQGGSGACAGCGGPLGMDGGCPTCGSSYVASLRQEISKVAGRSASFTVQAPNPNMSITATVNVVKSVVEPLGYKVKQANRAADGRPAVLVSVR